jgi:hypothetical protein
VSKCEIVKKPFFVNLLTCIKLYAILALTTHPPNVDLQVKVSDRHDVFSDISTYEAATDLYNSLTALYEAGELCDFTIHMADST